MLTILLVAFPLLLLLGVLGAARLERFVERQPRRRVATLTAADEPGASQLATVTTLAR